VDSRDQWIYLQLTSIAKALRRTEGSLPDGIHLRAVDKATHLSQIAALYNSAFSHAKDDILSPEELAHLVWHPGLSPKAVFLAFDGQQVVGLGVASADIPGQGTGNRRGAVELLAVRPDYQQQGIGRALLHALLSWLADREVQVIGASVDRPEPLVLLQRYGFVPAPSGERES
jgi:ribosomal protein S18 acetylase RimI-like enzyme